MPLTEETRLAAKQIIARYPRPRSALLPMLHLVQSEEGYVSPEGVRFCAEELGLTKAEVGAVATFYTMYKRRPAGEYLVSRLHQHPVRRARRRGDLPDPVGVARRRARRDHGRRADHAGARRVPGRLRLRAGGDGQLRVLRPADDRVGVGAGLAAAGRAAAAADARGAAVLVPGDLRASWPVSWTSARARWTPARRASPRWSATGWPCSAARPRPRTTGPPRSTGPPGRPLPRPPAPDRRPDRPGRRGQRRGDGHRGRVGGGRRCRGAAGGAGERRRAGRRPGGRAGQRGGAVGRRRHRAVRRPARRAVQRRRRGRRRDRDGGVRSGREPWRRRDPRARRRQGRQRRHRRHASDTADTADTADTRHGDTADTADAGDPAAGDTAGAGPAAGRPTAGARRRGTRRAELCH